jgi:hypothetical protein
MDEWRLDLRLQEGGLLVSENHANSERQRIQVGVVAAVCKVGYVLIGDYGWGRDFWYGHLEHPQGFGCELNVELPDALLGTSLLYDACSEDEWQVVASLIEDLKHHDLWCEGNYRLPSDERNGPYKHRYMMNIMKTCPREFEGDSFCRFLDSFAQSVIVLKSRIPGSVAG